MDHDEEGEATDVRDGKGCARRKVRFRSVWTVRGRDTVVGAVTKTVTMRHLGVTRGHLSRGTVCRFGV